MLDNPDTCGISEFARCVCDRTKLYYGVNKHGTVTSCTKKTGDLCDRPGIQLNQRGTTNCVLITHYTVKIDLRKLHHISRFLIIFKVYFHKCPDTVKLV